VHPLATLSKMPHLTWDQKVKKIERDYTRCTQSKYESLLVLVFDEPRDGTLKILNLFI